MHYIDVIIPIPLQKLFTYSITASEFDFIEPGMRVAVPFGKSKIYTGIVYRVHHDAPTAYEAKEIQQILDETPVVNQKQLKLWDWVSSYYMCTMGDVMRASLPSAFILESETVISKNNKTTIDESTLKDDEFLVYEALHHQSSLKIQDISNILSKKNVLSVIKRLIEKEAISVEEEVYEKYKPKLVRYVKLHTFYSTEKEFHELMNDLSRAPKQRDVVMTLFYFCKNEKTCKSF
ncbi:helicase PriA essential for oriC/DnaA-independent DNA replication [Algibacter lectus]|uniref:Helicase PriA essential for oriC/DnaA-independent DNA replication n=1 Tax=Algibacter lectus TaxID=221126 RepID=A0A090X5T0_9FLAO|nr:helicase PriA essential for oriC/DnaA-independent DNA replication [Algibacter lectus]